jgi:hypothetical protein
MFATTAWPACADFPVALVAETADATAAPERPAAPVAELAAVAVAIAEPAPRLAPVALVPDVFDVAVAEPDAVSLRCGPLRLTWAIAERPIFGTYITAARETACRTTRPVRPFGTASASST